MSHASAMLTSVKLLAARLGRDERGSVLSAEMMMLTTLLAIGVIVGAKSLRDSAVTELADWAQAIGNLDQSYNVPDDDMGTPDPSDDVIGSGFEDLRDFCDDADDDGPTDSSNAKINALPGGPVTYGVAPDGES